MDMFRSVLSNLFFKIKYIVFNFLIFEEVYVMLPIRQNKTTLKIKSLEIILLGFLSESTV